VCRVGLGSGARGGQGMAGPVGYGGPVVACYTAMDQDGVDFCREYVARHGYTREQVKIVQKNGCTVVIALAPLW